MERQINDFFSRHVRHFTSALEDFDSRLAADVAPASDEAVIALTAAINDSLAVCADLEGRLATQAPELLKGVQVQYREAIWPWFGKSWFMQRALEKPRGYPGDYAMLSAIYDGLPRSGGLGGYLDRYFLGTTLGQAVVARMQSARRFLLDEIARRGGKAAILNVACGPCREYAEGFSLPDNAHVRLTCIDNDSEALEFAQRQVEAALDGRVEATFVRYNALRMVSARGNVERFGASDVIYSVGLCDYIPDHVLVPMLKGWRESLAEGGVVYVAFKDATRYDKTAYQWLVDWFFLQRTADECRALMAQAGYEMERLETTLSADGVIINFTARSKVEARSHVDPREELPRAPHADVVVDPLLGEAAQPNSN